MSERIHSPSHYKRDGIEVADVIDMLDLDRWSTQAFQYVTRAQHKLDGAHEAEDMRKAAWFLRRAVPLFGKFIVLYRRDPAALQLVYRMSAAFELSALKQVAVTSIALASLSIDAEAARGHFAGAISALEREADRIEASAIHHAEAAQ